MTVPVGTIALAVASYFLYRARNAKSKAARLRGRDDVERKVEQGTGGREGPRLEVSSDQVPRQEMADSPNQLPSHEMATDSMYANTVLEMDGKPVLAEMDASGTLPNPEKPE